MPLDALGQNPCPVQTGLCALTRVGGTETVTVSNFTLQGLNKRAVAAQQAFTFRVGGR